MSSYGYQDNQRQPSGQEARRVQLANRNASTFNPISFNPEAQGDINDYEKQKKKDKQIAYRSQLDQMMTKNQSQRANEKNDRNVPDGYLAIGHREGNLGQDRADQQRYNQQGQENQRRQEEEAYLQEQYRKMAEYERYQQQMDDLEKNYSKPSNNYQDAADVYSKPTQEVRPQQYADVNRSPQKSQEDQSTFNQQDHQREQLLNRIKGGYNNQNTNVLNSYQRALEAQEKSKKDFEQSLVNKAAQDRQKEDVKAMTDWERKKRMQQEAADANRRAAELKMLDKKNQKAQDDALENQRAQDSLSQFERDNYRQKEAQRRMKEDANRVLEQQVRESHLRKIDKEQNVTQFGHPSRSNTDHYYDNNNQRQATTPLVPSYSKMNQSQPAGRNVEALDNLTYQMENKLSMKGPYARDDDYPQGYNQSQPYGGEPQSRHDVSGGSEYQKNRYKARNTGYNIITGDFR